MAKTVVMEANKLGWNLTEDGVELCKSFTKQQQPTTQDLLKFALNIDIAETSEKVLDDLQKKKPNEINGPVVLQVVKVRNVSAPKENEESKHAPRMLQLTLTDGYKHCNAIEKEFIKSLSLNTEPGSKICLLGCIEVRQSILLLKEKNIKVLGGRVENIYNKWMATKLASGFSRSANIGESAPLFVPFGQKISSYRTTNKSSQPKETKNCEKEFSEFDEQRTSAIAEIKKKRDFATDKSFTQRRHPDNQSNIEKSYEKNLRKKEFSTNQPAKTPRSTFQPFTKDDEKNCFEMEKMGFSFNEAKAMYQKCNNDMERAIDKLLSGETLNSHSDKHFSQDIQTQHENNDFGRNRRERESERGGREGGRGGRGGNRRGGGRGGGRGRGRRGRDDEEGDGDRPSSNTLFDFLETKITSSKPRQTSSKIDYNTQTSYSSNSKQNANVLNGDDLQEESIIEYVKKLSLVENYGGDNGDNGFSSNKSKPSRQDKISRPETTNPNTTSQSHADTKKTDDLKSKNNRYDNNRQQTYQNNNHKEKQYQPRSSFKPKQNEEFYKDKRSNYSSNTKQYEQNHNYKQTGGHSYKNDRATNLESRGDSRQYNDKYNEKQHSYDRNTSRSRQYGQNAVYSNRNSNQNDRFEIKNSRNFYRKREGEQKQFESKDQTSFKNVDQEKAPRFQKQESNQSNYTNKPSESSFSAGNTSKKTLTLAETGRQLKTHSAASETSSKTKNKLPTQNFYKPKSYSKTDDNPQNQNAENKLNKNMVTWKKGMSCFATYWEDNSSYPAIIQDIHEKNQTAVVLFTQYGNYEEVLFKDLRVANA